ncbi:MAG: hypothetical protein PHO02_03370 [Candidatus Nanoarchaeia archaeon]|nr:hypothetical protein [Candidatus Nanoarchaeia archaeon]
MVSITLAVPAEIKQDMDSFPEINWSAVAREAITRKIEMLKKFQEFSRKSEITEAEAMQLGKQVSAKTMKKHKG